MTNDELCEKTEQYISLMEKECKTIKPEDFMKFKDDMLSRHDANSLIYKSMKSVYDLLEKYAYGST